MRFSPIGFMSLFLLSMCVSVAVARTWHVKAHGRGDAPTIQAAIDSAQDGDTVILANGTYTGDGNRDIDYHGKAITVRSQSDNPRVCIIDCQGSESEPHRGFYFHSGEDSNSVLRGVTIKNGYAPTSDLLPFAPDAGRVRERLDRLSSRISATNEVIVRGSPRNIHPKLEALKEPWAVFMEQVTSSDSKAVRGGQLSLGVRGEQLLPSLADFKSSLEEVSISDQLYSSGGAIFCDGDGDEAASPRFVNCSFVHNSGGGVFASGAYWNVSALPLIFTNCGFSDNLGSGLAASGRTLTLHDCTFSDNSDHGLYAVAIRLTLHDCTFRSNSPTGLRCVWSDVTLVGCTFSGNGSGFVSFQPTGVQQLLDCEFFDNGVGAYCFEALWSMNNCLFSGNNTGVKFLDGRGELENCTFINNISQSWGAGGLQNSGLYEAPVRLNKCTFEGNRGGNGGAIGMCNDGRIQADSCCFRGNHASQGAVVYSPGQCVSLEFRGCMMEDNSASEGGVVYCAGPDTTGGWEPIVVSMANCTLHGNTSEQGGGIIFCEGSVSVELNSTIITGSTTGAAVYCSEVKPDPTLTCCDIFGNEGGDWVGCIQDQLGVNGNFSLDPLFCKPDKDEFGLSALSPCLPANNPCGVLIGAHGEGCNKSKGTLAIVSPKAAQVVLSSSPNPFNPATRITYTLATQGFVKLLVYDVAGRLVETLVDRVEAAGTHVVDWNARSLPSGIYFCRLEAGGVVQTQKLVLLK